MTLLEDRLAAAGDQLDDLIAAQVAVPHQEAGEARRSRLLALAASLVVVVGVAGLVWSGTRSDPGTVPPADETPAPAESGPAPATTFEPGAPGCGIDESQLVVVASATDSEGGTVDYLVADLPGANAEQLRWADESWSGGCDGDVPLASVHPTGAWTSAAAITSMTQTEVFVHGKLPAGSSPHEVLLSTGDLVMVTPTSDGWFLSIAVIAPSDQLEIVSTRPVTEPSTTPDDATTTVPVEFRPPVAIGESVMIGAAPQLQAGGFVVDASESRQADATADVVRELRAAGQIGTAVVIQVGTNGPVSQATLDEIMSSLPAEEVEQVVFLTVAAPRGWIEPNNALIRALPERYPNVTVLDWAAFVENEQVPGLADDGVHLGTGAAKQFYANYVFDVMGRRDLVQPLPEE